MAGLPQNIPQSWREPFPENGELEVDADEDSAYDGDSDQSSDRTSLASTIWRGVIENGRRYQAYKEGAYYAPIDDLQHEAQLKGYIAQFILDTRHTNPYFRSPIDPNAQNVLDIGCGSGRWAMDVADTFPNLSVIGVDLHPVGDGTVMCAPNCIFEVDDVTIPWTWNKKFDLIHIRSLFGCFTDPGWRGVYYECFKNMAPGGWIEQVETEIHFRSVDGSMPSHYFISEQWRLNLLEASRKMGRPLDTFDKFRGRIENAGFVNVNEITYKHPIGDWPQHPLFKEVGRLNVQQLVEGMAGYLMHLFTNYLGWSVDSVELLIEQVTSELQDQRAHLYYLTRRVWAQKPIEASPN